MQNEPKTSRASEQVKNELIAEQARENHYLGLTGAGFAAELLARDLIPAQSGWRSPVIFAAWAASLGGIIGDLHHSTAVARLRKELAASTTLSQG